MDGLNDIRDKSEIETYKDNMQFMYRDQNGLSMNVRATGAKKADIGKLRWSLLPTEPIQDIVRVLMFGAEKYGDFNWKKGFPWLDIYNSLKRHLDGDGDKCKGWVNGEDTDPESGLPHIAHIMCNAVFLSVYALTHTELDNRLKK